MREDRRFSFCLEDRKLLGKVEGKTTFRNLVHLLEIGRGVWEGVLTDSLCHHCMFVCPGWDNPGEPGNQVPTKSLGLKRNIW